MANPPAFDGSTSGAAWWRLFTQWVASHGTTDAELIVLSLESFLHGDALLWFHGLTDAQRASWKTVRPLFIARFPGADDVLFPPAVLDPVTDFHNFLNKRIEPKELLDVVEIEAADGSGRKEQVHRYQYWAIELYRKCARTPASDMSDGAMGHWVRSSMSDTLRRMVPSSVKGGKEICKYVAKLGYDDVHTTVTNEIRLKSVEAFARQMGARQQAGATYVTRGNDGASDTQQANGAQRTGGPSVTPLKAGEHLLYSDTPAGKEAYRLALEKYDKTYGTGMSLSVNRKFPLTPGTLAPGDDVCNNCGLSGHLQSSCNKTAVPERERRFRGMCAAAMRRSKVPTQFLDVVPDFLQESQSGQGKE